MTKYNKEERGFYGQAVRILLHKYLYYEFNKAYLTDYNYDMMEREYLKAIEVLPKAAQETYKSVTNPGFNEHHPFADRAINLANKFKKEGYL